MEQKLTLHNPGILGSIITYHNVVLRCPERTFLRPELHFCDKLVKRLTCLLLEALEHV